jgi:hypothetical protein
LSPCAHQNSLHYAPWSLWTGHFTLKPHPQDVKAGVINPDYQGEIKVILNNTSAEPFQIDPWKAIAQILFLPIMNLIVKSTTFKNVKTRGSRGFGSTDSQGFFSEENSHIESNSVEVETFASLVHLQPIKGQPPRTTFLGACPSQVDVRPDTPRKLRGV